MRKLFENIKLSHYQKEALNKLNDGWIFETDGVGADLVKGRERLKIHFGTFLFLVKNSFIELFEFNNSGVGIEKYRISK